MTNEQLVAEIRNGYSVTDNMQLLYQENLPLIKKIIQRIINMKKRKIYCKKRISVYMKL